MSAYSKNGLAKVKVVGRKAIVLDPADGERLLKQFYGKPLSIPKPKVDHKYREPLVLSLYETLYLCKRGAVEVYIGDSLADCETLTRYCEGVSHNFSIKYRVYEYLRDRNYVVRGGMKYGADFSVYTVGPGYEHAPYVITIMSKSCKLKPPDIVALGRVSHSVRKHPVLAIVDEDKGEVHYIVFKWIKL